MRNGCCVAKRCTPETCMNLPKGEMCGTCVHRDRCTVMFGKRLTDEECDWFPRRFSARAPSVDQGEGER